MEFIQLKILYFTHFCIIKTSVQKVSKIHPKWFNLVQLHSKQISHKVNAKHALKSTIFQTENFSYRVRFCIIVLDLSPVGAGVARSLDMGKVIGSNPILGKIRKPPFWVVF